MNGIELQARYSYAPCCLGYCGPRSFPAIFEGYLREKIDLSELKKEVDKFVVPCSYRALIAKHTNSDPDSYEVTEALWIGNKMLDNVPALALRDFIKTDLVKTGLDKFRAEKLAKNMPTTIVPHHSFHTLYIQFVSEEVPRDIDSFDQCKIGWGKVIGKTTNTLELEYSQLFFSKQFYLEKSNKTIKRGFVTDVKIGDFVSTHWGSAVQVITKRQVANLSYYTQKIIDAINGC